jgi:uncharacterized cupredoxin-like copper-binding protein
MFPSWSVIHGLALTMTVKNAPIMKNVPVRKPVLSLVVVMGVAMTAACGADSSTEPPLPSRSIEVVAVDYDFVVRRPPDIVAGEEITFVLTNQGSEPHEMQLLDERGRQLGAVPAIAPGTRGELTYRFERAGVHQIICDIEDHLTLGQRKFFEVTSQ